METNAIKEKLNYYENTFFALNRKIDDLFPPALRFTEALGESKNILKECLNKTKRSIKNACSDIESVPRNSYGLNKVNQVVPMIQGISIHRPVIALKRFNHCNLQGNIIKQNSFEAKERGDSDADSTSIHQSFKVPPKKKLCPRRAKIECENFIHAITASPRRGLMSQKKSTKGRSGKLRDFQKENLPAEIAPSSTTKQKKSRNTSSITDSRSDNNNSKRLLTSNDNDDNPPDKHEE
ncbi:uncharacterized protein LOC142331274 isoform X2 [Lycorma delicatula]|uniref:uncharacterized protein LOC142331274 isoform X2 n=1 Tax=Lycorma delicatula TaxID=130591 RepID=UPI003F51A3BE